MKKERFPVFGTLRFVFIAVVFMLLADHFIFGGKRSYIENAKTVKIEKPAPVRVQPENGAEFFELVPPVLPLPPGEGRGEGQQGSLIVPEDHSPSPKSSPGGRGLSSAGNIKIAIIIDDLGMDVKRSREVVALPAPVTLAFLPYGTKTRELAKAAKAEGHTLIIHTPMEAMDGALNIGPGGLKASMDGAAMNAAFNVMLNSFEGYEGINNHMGSWLTQDKVAMDRIMKVLAEKHLFFVDSMTDARSVGAHEAAEDGVPFAQRDVFLDHVDSAEFVKGALARLEKIARSKGSAIAIGHPKDHTISALKAWIPTLEAKGIELVSVKELLRHSRPVESISAEAGIQEGSVPVVLDPRLRGDAMEDRGGIAAPVYEPTLPEIQLHPLPEEAVPE